MKVASVLAWRLRRQLLDPVGAGSVVDVVERLGAVPAWPDTAAELAIGARRADGRTGDAARTLADGRLVKAYTFRGATHLMTPRDAGGYLALRTSSRMWELASWESYYGLAAADWPQFREYVRTALAGGPLTRSELAAALDRSPRYRHLRAYVTDGNDTLLKPLTWQGDMAMGPSRDGETTFLSPTDLPGWAGLPELDEAGRTVVVAYLRSYGPASAERIHGWFGKGLGARRRDIARWLDQLGDRLAQVDVGGEPALALAEDVAEIAATKPSAAVRLLPGRDPWVMAPGTADPRVVPPARRVVVSRSASMVVHRGALAGTWVVRGKRLDVQWFPESGRVPRAGLDEAAAALGRFLGRPLDLVVVAT